MRGPWTLPALALVLAALGGNAGAAPRAAAELATTQLPRGIRPLHYDVALVPNAADLRFDGRVTVTIDVARPTSRITLNAAGLTFASVRLAPARAGAEAVAPARIELDAQAQTVTFVFARPVGAGRHRLAMNYAGVIGRQAEGMFAIDYDADAERRRALFTQFENSHARHVIPSWDEPAYKATFTLDVTVPVGQMAVSNMSAASVRNVGAGLRRVRFATSPKMSTYLLFFGLGDFERVTARAGTIEIGIVSRRGTSAQAAFALASTQRILREFNAYFAVPYPLPKLDNIASPGGSRFFGAMENWGAIFTFEQFLLVDPSISTQIDRQRVFTFAAHEIAHQWFGNLVTMRWWDDVWLNEGFASWLEARTTQKLHPEWDTAVGAMRRRDEAMDTDAFQTTHAIVQHVDTVDQVSQAFDSITYAKGAAVIGMLEAYVGADAWRDGVRRYLKAHAYGNTVTDDLWRAIDAASARPVATVAHDFTRQPGIPLVRVMQSTCRDGKTTLALAQEEFSADRPAKAALRWHVPVIARVAGQAPARTLVADGQASLVVPGCGAVVVNAGRSGYYRTWYAPAQRAALRDAFARLDAVDQLGLINDAWALGLAGVAPIEDALELIARTPDDADPSLWGRIAERLLELDTLYRGAPARQARWRAYAVGRLAPVLARIGWRGRADEATPVTVLRAALIETLGALDDPATVAEARRRHGARATDPGAVPPGLRKSILAVVARHADAAAWEAMHAQARDEPSPVVKDRLYRYLADARDEALARRALDLALTGEVGATNAAMMVADVADEHPDLAFDFAVAQRERMDALLGDAARSRFYPRLATTSVKPAMVDKLQRFAEAHVPASSRRSVDAAIAQVRYRAVVASERLPAVDSWLHARGL